MARIVDLKLAPKLIEAHGPKLRKAVGLGLLSAAVRGVQVIQTQLIPAKVPAPVDRGLYRAGWRAGPLTEGGEVVGGEIWNVETHAAFIERGVRPENVKPGGAMIAALAEWAKRKGLDGADSPMGARAVAWAIALGMKKRGIFARGKGFRILEDLMTKRMPKIAREEVAREVKAALGKP